MDARMLPLPADPDSLPGPPVKLLHALYLASLGGNGQPPPPALDLALSASFGSVAAWRDEFVAMGRALGGGSGWVLLSFQPRDGTLVNQWASDHGHALAGAVPLLALDMYEHAHHGDHGAAAGAYVDAFMAHIDWAAVYARYQQAVHAAGDALASEAGQMEGAQVGTLDGALLLDVRRAGVYAQAATRIPGAQWQDPAAVGQWGAALAASLPAGQPVVVYCVYGHEVSRATALRLRAAGLQARFLQGGIDGWARAGRPLEAKAAGPAEPA